MIKKTRRKTLPALSPKAPAELRPLFAAMAEILETGEGVRGDKLDRKLTLRDMLDGGLAKLKVPGNPDAGLTLPSGSQNMAVPPRPIGFAADGSFFGMIHLSWEPPQEQYNNHSITNIYRSEEDNFATAEIVGREPGMFYSDKVRDDATSVEDPLNLPGYYYWISFVSESNVEGPPNSPSGTFAQPIPDAAYLLGQLSGQLGESELSSSLQSRIDKIDGPKELDGSVAQKLSKEADARLQAIADERNARIAAITESLGDAKSYADAKVAQEQQARANGFEALAIQIESIEAGLGGDYTVGMAVEKQARITGDLALATKIETLTSYAEGVAADVLTEQQARVSADEAIASDLTALYAGSEALSAEITDEARARVSGDKALSTVQQVISAANLVGSAALKVSSQIFISENKAFATRVEQMGVSIGDNSSAIQTEQQTRADGLSAVAEDIATLQTTIGKNTASIQSHSQSINGLSASYTLKTDVNGYVAGFGTYNDGTTADFAVLADRFWIAQPGKPDSAVKPFMVVDGRTYIDSAFIREASIQEGQLGPITFGKIFDSAGKPVTTLAGKLRADMLDVDQLRVGDANISGILKSSEVNSRGKPRWSLDKNGGMELNGASGSGGMEIRDLAIKVFDEAGRLRVQLGDLRA